MGTVTRPSPVKLICGFIFSADEQYTRARSLIEKRYGKADLESPAIPFTFTKHYAAEMGERLTRRFCSFPRLICPSQLASIKLWTNRLEERFLLSGNRRVNLDPGYVDMAKLVLASTKDFSHRIYLDKGIHAEVTLCYSCKSKSFKPWEWTYPDYRTPEYISIFNAVREIYITQIR
jgi:hypothetical protein